MKYIFAFFTIPRYWDYAKIWNPYAEDKDSIRRRKTEVSVATYGSISGFNLGKPPIEIKMGN